ncbi:chascon isoform d-related [Anaeramoeba flamelloides]|uniref:Chascon isoform d-related n=1 Tax=Anaeramoeba flamelloides TaxID=1746091 RepID=A0AAV7Y6V4_9EUKA|nr:chascon isoform d-related [Anaeramoeba flamelloides]
MSLDRFKTKFSKKSNNQKDSKFFKHVGSFKQFIKKTIDEEKIHKAKMKSTKHLSKTIKHLKEKHEERKKTNTKPKEKSLIDKHDPVEKILSNLDSFFLRHLEKQQIKKNKKEKENEKEIENKKKNEKEKEKENEKENEEEKEEETEPINFTKKLIELGFPPETIKKVVENLTEEELNSEKEKLTLLLIDRLIIYNDENIDKILVKENENENEKEKEKEIENKNEKEEEKEEPTKNKKKCQSDSGSGNDEDEINLCRICFENPKEGGSKLFDDEKKKNSN